jgi:hypothetical protein
MWRHGSLLRGTGVKAPGLSDRVPCRERARFARRPIRRLVESQLSNSYGRRTNGVAIRPALAWARGDIVSMPVNPFRSARAPALCCFPVLLLLSGCGDVGPECAAPEVRSSVIKLVADDRNNRLLKYAVESSDTVAELISHAAAEDEKSAILEKAKQDAIYALDDTIVVNSRTARAASCTGLLYVRVEDATAQKAVEFKVVQATDGQTSVSVKPFLF